MLHVIGKCGIYATCMYNLVCINSHGWNAQIEMGCQHRLMLWSHLWLKRQTFNILLQFMEAEKMSGMRHKLKLNQNKILLQDEWVYEILPSGHKKSLRV